eukprot:5591505-Prymnesium_polylepis.1
MKRIATQVHAERDLHGEEHPGTRQVGVLRPDFAYLCACGHARKSLDVQCFAQRLSSSHPPMAAARVPARP